MHPLGWVFVGMIAGLGLVGLMLLYAHAFGADRLANHSLPGMFLFMFLLVVLQKHVMLPLWPGEAFFEKSGGYEMLSIFFSVAFYFTGWSLSWYLGGWPKHNECNEGKPAG